MAMIVHELLNTGLRCTLPTPITVYLMSCSVGDVLVVLGDFNAKSSSDRAGYESCLDIHSFGARNEISQLLLDFEKSWGLWIGCFWFQISISRRLSWYSKHAR